MTMFEKKEWERALGRVSCAMADEKGTLPHEERLCAEFSLRSYEEDKQRKQNRPRLYALVHDLQKSS